MHCSPLSASSQRELTPCSLSARRSSDAPVNSRKLEPSPTTRDGELAALTALGLSLGVTAVWICGVFGVRWLLRRTGVKISMNDAEGALALLMFVVALVAALLL